MARAGQTGNNDAMPTRADTPASQDRSGCAGIFVLYIIKLPFMILRVVPHVGSLLRREAATATGERALASAELTPADDRAAITAALAQVESHDSGFDLAAVTSGVVRAREVVVGARQTGDASAARQVLSDGLWRVFVLLLDARAAHDVQREGTSAVVGASVVAATRDRLAEQLRLRLRCSGVRREIGGGIVLRGQLGEQTWDEDWIIRRSADATTPANGGILSGRCPQCGAPLQVDVAGSCGYCKALVLTGGRDWVVWSMEEAPWQ
jgi:hypothetical protein